ncbi:sodium:proton exchanger, partial [Mycobacteroides abscessus subsp. massiliense]
MPTTASTPAVVGGLRRQLLRSICTTALFMAPALITRVGGLHPSPVLALVIYGAAVV